MYALIKDNAIATDQFLICGCFNQIMRICTRRSGKKWSFSVPQPQLKIKLKDQADIVVSLLVIYKTF